MEIPPVRALGIAFPPGTDEGRRRAAQLLAAQAALPGEIGWLGHGHTILRGRAGLRRAAAESALCPVDRGPWTVLPGFMGEPVNLLWVALTAGSMDNDGTWRRGFSHERAERRGGWVEPDLGYKQNRKKDLKRRPAAGLPPGGALNAMRWRACGRCCCRIMPPRPRSRPYFMPESRVPSLQCEILSSFKDKN